MTAIDETAAEARRRRLEELDRISAIQSALNADLTEADAEALIQRYLAEKHAERKQRASTFGNDSE